MFLNPFLLFGLTAVSVPIIIHLLNRRKFERVVWAAMRFITQAVEQNQRRIRVEDLILLALRCLIIALVALALARPALRKLNSVLSESGVTAVLLLDNSYSMSMREGDTSRFDQAKLLADRVLQTLPRGSNVSLMLASDVVTPVIAEPTVQHEAVRKAIHNASLSDRGSDMLPALKKAIDSLQARPAVRKEIYLVTDTQAAGWRQAAEIQQAIEAHRKEIAVNLLFIGPMPAKNLGISGLRMITDIAAVNRPLRFEVQVTNYGVTTAADVPVKLSVDNEPVADAASTGEIPPGQSKSVSLAAKFRTEGYHGVTAQIPTDALPADDTRHLVVRAVKNVSVLLIDGEPGREERESKTFFLERALQPIDPALREGFYIHTRTAPPAQLTTQRLDDFDAVFLANVAELAAGDVPALERYVKAGGGLVVFPGANANVPFYNEQFYTRRSLLPAAIGPARGDAGQMAKFSTFQGKGYDHPIVDIWNAQGVGNLGAAHFYRAYDLLPGGHASVPKDVVVGPAQTVLRYEDGRPAVMDRAWGAGRVVLFSSGADTAWNDLPVRPKVFLPLLHRVLGALVGRENELVNLRVGEPLVLARPAELLGREVAITPPGEGKVAPESARLELAGNTAVLRFDRTERAGVYTAAIGKNPADSVKFAAVRPPEESRIDPLPAAQLKALGSVANVVEWKSGMQIEQVLQQARTGREIWLPLALAALLLATAETFLAHWFSRPK